ncbi:MAG: hypothetical protein ABIQ60_01405, partial [Burkholderiaceae bacterium]
MQQLAIAVARRLPSPRVDDFAGAPEGTRRTACFPGQCCRLEGDPRMIIDCHGHYTTAPKALENWRQQQIAGINDPSARPKVADLKISDDELR